MSENERIIDLLERIENTLFNIGNNLHQILEYTEGDFNDRHTTFYKQTTPIPEEAWEPKFGDWVTYTGTQVNSFVPGTKALITGFDLYEEPHEVFLELEGGDCVWVPITSITKWKEAQP